MVEGKASWAPDICPADVSCFAVLQSQWEEATSDAQHEGHFRAGPELCQALPLPARHQSLIVPAAEDTINPRTGHPC